MRRDRFVRVFRTAYLASLLFGALLVCLSALLEPVPARAASSSGQIDVADFKVAITPVSAQYYQRIIQNAENDGAQLVIFEIDTPGGLVESMQSMVQTTLASTVPVVAYVSPQGAMAASAGVFLVYSAHVAAMAPNSTIGSSEVILNSGSGTDTSSTPETGDAAAERRKVTNMLVSLIRNLADEHGRNPDFGEQAVRQSQNLGAQAALNQHVVDILAPGINSLVTQLDGKQVKMQSGTVTLHTKGAQIHDVGRTPFEEILFVITDPSVAFILISLGTLGITWEFINPGAVFPGVIGAILLIVGLLAVGTLPVNAAGLIFLALAFVMFIADVFMPTHGILTVGGVASLALGGMILINTGSAPGVPGVSPLTVAGVALGLGGFFFFAVYKVFQARRWKPQTGMAGMVGQIAETRTDLAPSGQVFVEGELWKAVSLDGSLPSGQKVRVVGANGLTLTVKRADVPAEKEAVAVEK